MSTSADLSQTKLTTDVLETLCIQVSEEINMEAHPLSEGTKISVKQVVENSFQANMPEFGIITSSECQGFEDIPERCVQTTEETEDQEIGVVKDVLESCIQSIEDAGIITSSECQGFEDVPEKCVQTTEETEDQGVGVVKDVLESCLQSIEDAVVTCSTVPLLHESDVEIDVLVQNKTADQSGLKDTVCEKKYAVVRDSKYQFIVVDQNHIRRGLFETKGLMKCKDDGPLVPGLRVDVFGKNSQYWLQSMGIKDNVRAEQLASDLNNKAKPNFTLQNTKFVSPSFGRPRNIYTSRLFSNRFAKKRKLLTSESRATSLSIPAEKVPADAAWLKEYRVPKRNLPWKKKTHDIFELRLNFQREGSMEYEDILKKLVNMLPHFAELHLNGEMTALIPNNLRGLLGTINELRKSVIDELNHKEKRFRAAKHTHTLASKIAGIQTVNCPTTFETSIMDTLDVEGAITEGPVVGKTTIQTSILESLGVTTDKSNELAEGPDNVYGEAATEIQVESFLPPLPPVAALNALSFSDVETFVDLLDDPVETSPQYDLSSIVSNKIVVSNNESDKLKTGLGKGKLSSFFMRQQHKEQSSNSSSSGDDDGGDDKNSIEENSSNKSNAVQKAKPRARKFLQRKYKNRYEDDEFVVIDDFFKIKWGALKQAIESLATSTILDQKQVVRSIALIHPILNHPKVFNFKKKSDKDSYSRAIIDPLQTYIRKSIINFSQVITTIWSAISPVGSQTCLTSNFRNAIRDLQNVRSRDRIDIVRQEIRTKCQYRQPEGLKIQPPPIDSNEKFKEYVRLSEKYFSVSEKTWIFGLDNE